MAEKLMDPLWVVLEGEYMAIRLWQQSYDSTTEFRVYSIAVGSNEEVFLNENVCGAFDATLDDWETAYWEISGAVKWDGCINWHTNEQCQFHGCGPEIAERMKTIFQAIYHFAGVVMPRRDFETVERPDNVTVIITA